MHFMKFEKKKYLLYLIKYKMSQMIVKNGMHTNKNEVVELVIED